MTENSTATEIHEDENRTSEKLHPPDFWLSTDDLSWRQRGYRLHDAGLCLGFLLDLEPEEVAERIENVEQLLHLVGEVLRFGNGLGTRQLLNHSMRNMHPYIVEMDIDLWFNEMAVEDPGWARKWLDTHTGELEALLARAEQSKGIGSASPSKAEPARLDAAGGAP